MTVEKAVQLLSSNFLKRANSIETVLLNLFARALFNQKIIWWHFIFSSFKENLFSARHIKHSMQIDEKSWRSQCPWNSNCTSCIHYPLTLSLSRALSLPLSLSVFPCLFYQLIGVLCASDISQTKRYWPCSVREKFCLRHNLFVELQFRKCKILISTGHFWLPKPTFDTEIS